MPTGSPGLKAQASRLFADRSEADDPDRASGGPGRGAAASAAAARLGRSSASRSSVRRPVGRRPRDRRRSLAIDLGGMVRSPLPLHRVAVCDQAADELMDAARQTPVAGAALRPARAGGGADRHRPAVHADRRARCAGRWSPRASRTSPGTVTPATRSPTWRYDLQAEIEAGCGSTRGFPFHPSEPTRSRCASASRRWRRCSSGC